MNRVRSLIQGEECLKRGFTGRGITVAFLDSGIYTHPDLKKRIIGFQDFQEGRIGRYDDYGHGTHVAGIFGGDGRLSAGKYRGIAPECFLLPVKILDQNGNGNCGNMLKALEWIMKNRHRFGIRVVNISVGTFKEEENNRLIEAVEAVWDAGITVVAAAGNEGPKNGSVTSPGSSRKVITVGAMDDENGRQKGYSGRGPTAACIIKPEILAPGSGLISCNAKIRYTRKPYTVKSGTSMATSVVTGAVTLLLEKNPELSNIEIKMRLKNCAEDMGKPKNEQGWGRLNLKKLLDNTT